MTANQGLLIAAATLVAIIALGYLVDSDITPESMFNSEMAQTPH